MRIASKKPRCPDAARATGMTVLLLAPCLLAPDAAAETVAPSFPFQGKWAESAKKCSASAMTDYDVSMRVTANRITSGQGARCIARSITVEGDLVRSRESCGGRPVDRTTRIVDANTIILNAGQAGFETHYVRCGPPPAQRDAAAKPRVRDGGPDRRGSAVRTAMAAAAASMKDVADDRKRIAGDFDGPSSAAFNTFSASIAKVILASNIAVEAKGAAAEMKGFDEAAAIASKDGVALLSQSMSDKQRSEATAFFGREQRFEVQTRAFLEAFKIASGGVDVQAHPATPATTGLAAPQADTAGLLMKVLYGVDAAPYVQVADTREPFGKTAHVVRSIKSIEGSDCRYKVETRVDSNDEMAGPSGEWRYEFDLRKASISAEVADNAYEALSWDPMMFVYPYQKEEAKRHQVSKVIRVTLKSANP